ncbi:MAG: YwmB family TATA-box binding protein [Lachnospiraceae bacterium]
MSRKVKISFLVLIWGIVVVQSFINWKCMSKEDTVTTFHITDHQTEEIFVTGYGYLGTDYLSEEKKKEILNRLAKELGIKADSPIVSEKKDNCRQWSLASGDGKAMLEFVSLKEDNTYELNGEEENYLFIEMKDMDNKQDGEKRYKIIQDEFNKMGISASVNMECLKKVKGNVQNNKKLRQKMVQELFENENIEKVLEEDTKDFYTVYGFREGDQYITDINGQCVNRQVVISYEESEACTYIKIGYPIVNSDY